MTRTRRGVVVGLIGIACALALPPGAGAVIPGTPSQWNSLTGLNAASGAPWVRSLAVSGASSVGYAGLEGGGVYRSTDGGATWSAFNAGFPSPAVVKVRGLSADGATVHAATDSGIWRSTGGAWARVGPDRAANAIASPSAGALLAGVEGAGVWHSADGGATWTAPAAGNGMPSGETIRGLGASVPGRVYATGDGGVYVSADAGATWTRRSDGIPAAAAPLVTWGYPQRPDTAYTATDANGVYRTLNGGLTWAPVNDGLGAVQAHALQVFTSSQGVHLYAATEDGLWHALDTGTAGAPAPRWSEVTKDGLFEAGGYHYDMWALTPPTLVGVGGLPGVIAGTRTNGGYFLSFLAPDNACSETNPTSSSPCPRVTGTVEDGRVLTASRGTWTGTGILDYAYQWEQCTSATAGSCTPVDGAQETSFVVPPSGVGLRYRIRITAATAHPSFGVFKRYSTITAAATANAGNYPGSTQRWLPDISVTPPGATTEPAVGDQLFAEYGTTPSASSDGWFNPAATSRTFQWLRCDDAGAGCEEIPGATARNYTLQPADGARTLRVRVRGVNADGTAEVTSGASYYVVPAPAAIGDPLPVGGTARSQAPAVLGAAVVGQTLAGDVGGWKDPTTDFARRWVRCDAAGNACAPIGSESGPTYVVRAEDVGSTLRLRVTADVNGDLADGGGDGPPAAVTVDSAPTAVVTVPSAPGTGTPTPAPLPLPTGVTPRDTTAPRLSKLSITKKAFAAGGKGTKIKVTLSERATLRITIAKPATGRRVGKACKPQTKANRRRKACTYNKTQTTLRRANATGAVTVAFTGKIGKRKLAPGRYTATLVATDAAGNASKPATLRFTITRR